MHHEMATLARGTELQADAGGGWQSSTANEARVSAHTGAAGTCDGGDLKGGTERGFSVLLLLQRFNGAARQCKQQFVCDGCDMLPKKQT